MVTGTDPPVADTMIATTGARTRRAPLPELPPHPAMALGLATATGLATTRRLAMAMGPATGLATAMVQATQAQAQHQGRGATPATTTLIVVRTTHRPTARKTQINDALEATWLQPPSRYYDAGRPARVSGKSDDFLRRVGQRFMSPLRVPSGCIALVLAALASSAISSASRARCGSVASDCTLRKGKSPTWFSR